MTTAPRSFTYRNRYFLLTDILLFVSSALISFVLRLESVALADFVVGLVVFIGISLGVKLGVFVLNGVYSHYWKSAGPSELILVSRACLIAGMMTFTVTLGATMVFSYDKLPLPRSVAVIDFLLTTLLVISTRFSVRATSHLRMRRIKAIPTTSVGKRAVIIGAGQTGVQVLDTLSRSRAPITAIGFLDDDKNKVGAYVRGLKVLGRLVDLPELVRELDVNFAIIAMPSAPGSVIRQISQTCQKIGLEHQIVPSLYELATGKISVNALRPVEIDDLLRRAPIKLEVRDIETRLRGRRVLVTGAGGSIGSELTRQIARFQPERLLLVGHGENSLFAIEQRLKNEFPLVPCQTLLVDVQDLARLHACFEQWQPDVVFHAAAHKHVPMLESNVSAAVLNNVIGTQNIIDLCNEFQVQRMILISTDKAVEPTSVMGMSKRVAELLVLNASLAQSGRFAAVRFGNVLGSRGSVVPIFQQQIAAGGPLTVTSDQMTRFFMSIPEAVLLLLKASVLIDCGPLFVLNMGEPVRIVDLAHDLIKLSGLVPGRDIEIKITGMRPGEKYYEELFWPFEEQQPVEQGAIFALNFSQEQARLIADRVPGKVSALIAAALSADEDQSRRLLRELAFVITPEPMSAALPTPLSVATHG